MKIFKDLSYRSFSAFHRLVQHCVFVLDAFQHWSTVLISIGKYEQRQTSALSNHVLFRFHEWPETALVSVAKRFIQDVESLPKEYQDSVAEFMAYVHSSVNEMSVQYLTVCLH